LTAEGDATAVEVGSTLVFYAAPNVALHPDYYALEWSLGDTHATISPLGEAHSETLNAGATAYVATVTGATAGDVVVTAELKTVSYVAGVRTLTAFDTPIKDTITLTVSADSAPTATAVHTLLTKKVVYTFSEKVQLITGNSLWPGYPGPIIPFAQITHDLFNIYELNEAYEYVTTGSPAAAVPVTGTAISALSFDSTGKIATFTYTGTIPNVAGHHYVIDCMGYTITDEVGTELAISVGATFEYNA
jgi:hypothetical protein